VTPRGNGNGGRDSLLANLRRAWFLRNLHRRQEEEPLPGAAPHLNFRQRRLIKAMLAKPGEPWTLGVIWYTFLLLPMTVAELGEDLSQANLAYVRWIDGKRCLLLTEVGVAELPTVLELYRSQAPLLVLLRRGPRAAAVVWWLRHRDRKWRRRLRRERRKLAGGQAASTVSGDSGHSDSGHGGSGHSGPSQSESGHSQSGRGDSGHGDSGLLW
jgi:uncharacterized membrane protein YgcG